MVVHTQQIHKDFFLVLYDISDNITRNWFRDKLYRMGGMEKTESCYLVPKSVRSVDEVMAVAKERGVRMEIFGLEITDEQAETLSKKYVKELEQRLDEIDKWASEAWERLKDVEENLDDPKKSSMTGLHNMMKGIRDQCAEVMTIINRWGNEKDEFELQKLEAFIQRITDRFERLRAHKNKRVDEGFGLE